MIGILRNLLPAVLCIIIFLLLKDFNGMPGFFVASTLFSFSLFKKKQKAVNSGNNADKDKPSFKAPVVDLADVLDTKEVQLIMDDFYALTGIGIAIIDMSGRVLVETGWQEICTEFHRRNPETRRYCIESDTQLTKGVNPHSYKLYKCKNGMWDVATPIMLGDRQIGNIFTGQFFFDDEKIDYNFFKNQAEKYGFNQDSYLAALSRVPKFSRKTIERAMSFYTKVASVISHISYSNLKLSYVSFHDELTLLYNRRYLKEEMNRYDSPRQLPISIIICDINGLKLINDAYGPEKGNALLKKTAEILRDCCRREDAIARWEKESTIARWGSDEFVIFLPQTPEKYAEKICARIAEASKKVHIDGLIPLSVSLGSATKKSNNISNMRLLNKAEDNMHKHKLSESRSARSAVLSALMKTLGEKSYETEEHARRLQKMALKVGKKRGLNQSECDRLAVLVSLHDIGKITISGDILTKPDSLNESEMAEIKKHPETGARIASLTEEFSHVAKDILSHHERWDGKGYPLGLKGKEIPVLARIASVVDAYDVMTSQRSYKKSMTSGEAIKELKEGAGTQFDPEIVEIFIALANEGKVK